MSIIKVVNKPYQDINILDNIVAYALDVPVECLNEYIPNVRWMCYGVNPLTPQHMISSFKKIKEMYNKDSGKQIHHFVLSIYKRNYLGIENKEKWCELICEGVGFYLRSLGFQNMAFIHVNNHDCNVHVHFIVNSVNGFTGNKLSNERTFYQNILSFLRKEYQILNWEFITYG